MTQYIDKAIIKAELKRIEYETNYEPFTGEVLGKRCACKSLLSFIDTLDVKEVDLEEEVENYFKGWSEDVHNGAACHYQYVDLQDCKSIAKHFFELGLKVQKGE